MGIDILNTCDELLFSISIPSMIELALQVASGLIIFIVCMFAWSSTILAEEKKKRKKDKDSDK